MAKENNPEIPTKEEIASLPRWARVAFAARCARRVQPLFVHEWPNALQKEIDNVDRVITLAESSAASHNNASEFSTGTPGISTSTEYTTYSAYSADSAAASAASAYSVDFADSAIASAYSAARDAYSAIFAFASTTNAGIRTDFELLKGLARGEPNMRATVLGQSRFTDQDDTRVVGYSNSWTDDTPVPPEIFGPMWPDGEPEGWPLNGEDELIKNAVYQLSITGPDGVDAGVVGQRTIELLRLMDRYVRASGGGGVQLIDDADVGERSPCSTLMPVGGGV